MQPGLAGRSAGNKNRIQPIRLNQPIHPHLIIFRIVPRSARADLNDVQIHGRNWFRRWNSIKDS
jgi:hypothetical protein